MLQASARKRLCRHRHTLGLPDALRASGRAKDKLCGDCLPSLHAEQFNECTPHVRPPERLRQRRKPDLPANRNAIIPRVTTEYPLYSWPLIEPGLRIRQYPWLKEQIAGRKGVRECTDRPGF